MYKDLFHLIWHQERVNMPLKIVEFLPLSYCSTPPTRPQYSRHPCCPSKESNHFYFLKQLLRLHSSAKFFTLKIGQQWMLGINSFSKLSFLVLASLSLPYQLIMIAVFVKGMFPRQTWSVSQWQACLLYLVPWVCVFNFFFFLLECYSSRQIRHFD